MVKKGQGVHFFAKSNAIRSNNIIKVELNDANGDNAEAIALRIEHWLYRVSVALKHDDIRHRPFGE
jgi:hypothetical protein